jgi:hypothetical protein
LPIDTKIAAGNNQQPGNSPLWMILRCGRAKNSLPEKSGKVSRGVSRGKSKVVSRTKTAREILPRCMISGFA